MQETETEKTRKGIKGRRYRGRVKDRVDKTEKTRKGMVNRRYRGKKRQEKRWKQKIQGERRR